MFVRLLLTIVWVAAAIAAPSAQTDLDAFMSRVLERRDENWKKLQQYVLEEHETLQLTGPGAQPVFGFERVYAWFPRDGVFVKSPLRADGVAVGDADRRRAEDRWIAREERRKTRRDAPAGAPQELTEAGVREALEPGFVSAAYFLRFKFDPGQYALAGRETLEGREVLRIEYYPARLFGEGRMRPNRELRERDPEVVRKMNKTALVTLWVDPREHQILKYTFTNTDLDFLPGRWLVRIDQMEASMEMGQPFPGVWLPRSIRMGFDLTMAIGGVEGRYAADFRDYRLASVTTRVR